MSLRRYILCKFVDEIGALQNQHILANLNLFYIVMKNVNNLLLFNEAIDLSS